MIFPCMELFFVIFQVFSARENPAGKALRKLVDIARLAERFNMPSSQRRAGKLNIKTREPGILFINLCVTVVSIFKLAIMT